MQEPSTPADRNKEPIRQILDVYLQPGTRVLETGAGSGVHAMYVGERYPQIHWQPSNPDEGLNAVLTERLSDSNLPNVAAPILLNVEQEVWPVTEVDLVVSINMLHISPWSAALGLFKGAAKVLKRDGYLYVYGPFKREGVPTAPGNQAFDQSLKSRDPAWGVRAFEDVVAA
ncbi:MAG: DUF938 domain-containing protein, partial [Proteobacteria bacterium]|nr:DUF938 domain-containing protein [Pseudomonadota bacterium]